MSNLIFVLTIARYVLTSTAVLATFTANNTDFFLLKNADLIQFSPPADFVRINTPGSGNIAEYWNSKETMFIYLWLDAHSNNKRPAYDNTWQIEYQLTGTPNLTVHKSFIFPNSPQPGGTPIAYCYYPTSNGTLSVAIFSATGKNNLVDIDEICNSVRSTS
jgi:hypothetical protein